MEYKPASVYQPVNLENYIIKNHTSKTRNIKVLPNVCNYTLQT